ncbi:MAG: hypothetical protein NT062_15465 [Proteobacteria bacterium]|nr:hypothetical protein [Pseudomonadota bacterium]
MVSDLLVAPYRKGQADIKKSFALGVGPSREIEVAILALQDLVDEEDLDEALVQRVAWMNDWEEIVLGAEPRKHWKRVEAADTTIAVCAPKELERILAAMKTLRPHVRASRRASWDEFTVFLHACAKNGGSVCLWYDPMG